MLKQGYCDILDIEKKMVEMGPTLHRILGPISQMDRGSKNSQGLVGFEDLMISYRVDLGEETEAAVKGLLQKTKSTDLG